MAIPSFPAEPRREFFLDRPLPSSIDSEQVVLGAILIDNAVMPQAAEKLAPDDFYSPMHRAVYEAMLTLFQRHKAIDPILIAEEMKKLGGMLEAFGGVTVIANLTFGLPHFTDVEEYILIVRDKSKARALVRLCTEVTSQTLKEDEPIAVTLDRAEQAIFDLANERVASEAQHLYLLALEAAGEKVRQMKEGVPMTGRTTGLRDLDLVIGGYHKKNLIIAAGRPGMGKSAFVTKSLIDGIIFDPGSVGILFTPEMGKEEVVERIICQYADVNLWRYRHNQIRDTEWQHIASNIIAPFEGINLYIDDTPRISVLQMQAKARRVQARHKRLDIVAVDHIGHMDPGKEVGRNASEADKIGRLTGDLLAMAKTMDIPVVALSQLSREVEKRNPPKPIMPDLRSSGSIEQDAHVVLFMYRPGYYEKDRAEKRAIADQALIIVGKNRSGPPDEVKVAWVGTCAKFVDLDRDEETNQQMF